MISSAIVEPMQEMTAQITPTTARVRVLQLDAVDAGGVRGVSAVYAGVDPRIRHRGAACTAATFCAVGTAVAFHDATGEFRESAQRLKISEIQPGSATQNASRALPPSDQGHRRRCGRARRGLGRRVRVARRVLEQLGARGALRRGERHALGEARAASAPASSRRRSARSRSRAGRRQRAASRRPLSAGCRSTWAVPISCARRRRRTQSTWFSSQAIEQRRRAEVVRARGGPRAGLQQPVDDERLVLRARQSGVAPVSRAWFASAFACSSRPTMSTRPFWHATGAGLAPVVALATLTLAPDATSVCTHSKWPSAHATKSGVAPSGTLGRSTVDAPAASSTSTAPLWPLATASASASSRCRRARRGSWWRARASATCASPSARTRERRRERRLGLWCVVDRAAPPGKERLGRLGDAELAVERVVRGGAAGVAVHEERLWQAAAVFVASGTTLCEELA